MEKKLESERIYDGTVLHVTKDKVLCDNGEISYREIIHHTGGIAALVIKNHQILLVKQYRYSVSQNTLEIPAGKLEKGEEPKEASLRELEEETGYTSNDIHLALKFLPTPGYTSEMIYIYQMNNIKRLQTPKQGDSDEAIEVLWLNLDDAYNKILSGEILDGKTIISIMYAIKNNL